nr:hypothetical protein [Tanacetum cinerariifolium]
MEQLGDDELTCILYKIPNRNDVKSFSRVSKQFLKVACIRRRSFKFLHPDRFDDMLPASPNLKSFDFTEPLSNTHMKLLAWSCPNLTQLRIGLEQKLDPEMAVHELDEKIPHTNYPNSISEISKHFLKAASIRLRSLNVSLPNVLNGMIPASLSFDFFGFLKPLLNTHTEILPQSFPNLDLASISLEKNIHYDDDEYVPGEFEFDDNGLCAVANACSYLQYVYLSRRLGVGDVGISLLVKSCRNLRVLVLDGCLNVKDESLKAIGESNCLEQLSLRCCWITDLGLEYLASGDLKNCLDTLCLAECDMLTDNGIAYLKEMCCLTNLDLSKCGVNITDKGVVAISQLTNIEILNFSWLNEITSCSLFEIASNCLKLRTIDLSGSDKITIYSIDAFRDHPTLEVINVFSCHNIFWEDVISLGDICENFHTLGLSINILGPWAKEHPQDMYLGHKHYSIEWE